MEYLKDYARDIIIVSILSAVFEILIPEGKNKKYVITVLGLIVMLSVMRPISFIANIKNNIFNLPTFEVETSAVSYEKDLVAEKFEKNLAEKIIDKVKEDTNETICCTLKTARNENGEITAISHIEISPFSDITADFISREFDIDKTIIKEGSND